MPKGSLLILTLVFLILFGGVPTNANEENQGSNHGWSCTVEWTQSPNRLANYLWGSRNKNEVAAYFTQHGLPDLSPDLQQDTSTILKQTINDNTTLAIELSRVFDFGIPPATNTNMTVDYYGKFWNPIWIGGASQYSALDSFQRGATLQEVISCLRDEHGFDYDFIAASLNYAFTRGAMYESCAFHRDKSGPPSWTKIVTNAYGVWGPKCLDPAVYGNEAYVISMAEPSWVFTADGHVSFFGYGATFGVPVNCNDLSQCRSQNTQPASTNKNNTLMRWSLDKLFGGGNSMLIIPEEVARKVGGEALVAASALITIITYGITPVSPAHPNVLQFTQQDWEIIQTGYRNLRSALSDYAKEKKELSEYNMVNIRRFPVDTRLPEQMKGSLTWDGFPDPIDEMADAMSQPSCKVSECILQGHDMAEHYAKRVYDFLMLTAMFSQPQRTAYFKAWMVNYITQTQLDQIPSSQLDNYAQAIGSYKAAKNPPNPTPTQQTTQDFMWLSLSSLSTGTGILTRDAFTWNTPVTLPNTLPNENPAKSSDLKNDYVDPTAVYAAPATKQATLGFIPELNQNIIVMWLSLAVIGVVVNSTKLRAQRKIEKEKLRQRYATITNATAPNPVHILTELERMRTLYFLANSKDADLTHF